MRLPMRLPMRLNGTQTAEYGKKGYVLVPGLFSEEETGVLDAATGAVTRRDGPEVAREKDGSPHVVYGMHLLDDRLRTLTRHPRLVEPSRQLLGREVFVHQSRVNVKQTGGSIVAWHQDFGTYHRVDGIPEPRGLMIAVFLDDVMECNAPLMCLPGSHVHGIVSEARIDETVEDHERAARYRYDIAPERMAELVAEHGIETITGPRGSVLFMNMNVVHGSTVNITPLRRIILYINVSAVDNRGESFARPEYLAARDFEPIEPLDDGCLLQFAERG